MPSIGSTTNEKWTAPSEVEWLQFAKVGDSSTGSGYQKTWTVPSTSRVNDTGTYIYLGWAIPGSSESDAVWRIARIDTSGNKIWADGDALFNNSWTEREVISYS
jgi:hypothetical protein